MKTIEQFHEHIRTITGKRDTSQPVRFFNQSNGQWLNFVSVTEYNEFVSEKDNGLIIVMEGINNDTEH